MSLIFKLPGPLLVFFGACFLSFGGLIVKSFEGSTLWQILFWRQFFFLIIVTFFLVYLYKSKIFKTIYVSGIPGLIGGIILGLGFSSYVFAMYNTTVANANFIIQTQFIFLAIFGYFFLNERISTITLISIILAFSGIIMLTGDNLTSGQTIGNIVAFVMPLSFAVLILVVRKFPNVDMLPLQLTAGLFAMLIGFFLSPTIFVSSKDIFLGFIAGFFQVGIGFILITIGARNTPSAIVGILMLTEAVLGPMWAWLFLNEKPPIVVIFGGSVIILAVFIQFYSMLSKEKNKIK